MKLLAPILNFAELERYSTDEYLELVYRAKKRRGDAIWVLPGLAGFIGAALWIGVAIGLWMLMTTAPRRPSLQLDMWWILNIGVAGAIALATILVVRGILIIRSIKRIVNKAACPFCEFSLIGLKVHHDPAWEGKARRQWVKCPECGQRVHLSDLHIWPEDLLPQNQRNAPPPAIGAGETGAYTGARERQPKVAPTRR